MLPFGAKMCPTNGLPPPCSCRNCRYCFDISLIRLFVNRLLNQFLATETEFIVYSRFLFCTVNEFSHGPLLLGLRIHLGFQKAQKNNLGGLDRCKGNFLFLKQYWLVKVNRDIRYQIFDIALHQMEGSGDKNLLNNSSN